MLKHYCCGFILLTAMLNTSAFADNQALHTMTPGLLGAEPAAARYHVDPNDGDEVATALTDIIYYSSANCSNEITTREHIGGYSFRKGEAIYADATSIYDIAESTDEGWSNSAITASNIASIRITPLHDVVPDSDIFDECGEATQPCFNVDCSNGSQCIYSGNAKDVCLNSFGPE